MEHLALFVAQARVSRADGALCARTDLDLLASFLWELNVCDVRIEDNLHSLATRIRPKALNVSRTEHFDNCVTFALVALEAPQQKLLVCAQMGHNARCTACGGGLRACLTHV